MTSSDNKRKENRNVQESHNHCSARPVSIAGTSASYGIILPKTCVPLNRYSDTRADRRTTTPPPKTFFRSVDRGHSHARAHLPPAHPTYPHTQHGGNTSENISTGGSRGSLPRGSAGGGTTGDVDASHVPSLWMTNTPAR